MKSLVLLLSVFFIGSTFSQEEAYPQEKLYQVSPHWKVGDQRKVHTDISTKVIYDGVMVSNQRTIYDVNLRVLSTDDQFLLQYSSFDRLPSVLSSSEDGSENTTSMKIHALLREAEVEIAKSDLKIQVNKETGVALEIKNGLEVSKKVEHSTRKELRAWAANEKMSEKDILNMEIEFGKRFEAMYPKIQQTILDKTSLIFSPYNIAFPMNSSMEREVMTRDITAASKSDTLFPAIMKIESIEVNDKMVVKTSLDYDKEFLLEQLKKSYNKLEKVKPSEVSIIEKEEILFNLNTTWIHHHTTNLYFEIPGMKTLTKSSVTFL